MDMESYFQHIDAEMQRAYQVAQSARKKGYDPHPDVEIPIARNMAERVVGLISIVAPQLINSGVSARIMELEQQYGFLDWRISLIIAEEVAAQKFCTFSTPLEAMEVGIRVGLAYHTLGTVSSPLEGFTHLKLRKNGMGNDYFAVCFSGPIRSAGGTGASFTVILADYIRKKMGFDTYDPTEKEVKRMATELRDYHERVTNLQYFPSEAEVDFLIRHLPVQIDGDPSEKIEVSNYKDLPRIETNAIRNGPCLVLGEGIAQKAPKLWKQLSKWGAEFSLEHWSFLKDFIELQKGIKAGQASAIASTAKIRPDYTFITDLVAGRPVLTHPLAPGGFRLRFGRSRASGYSSCSIHPATMHVLESYIAIGTQLKVERPGKATALTSCDTIEGPIVEVEDGSVYLVTSEKEAKQLAPQIVKIHFLGDILINYGDFLNRAHPLAPPGYCEEWYALELEKATVTLFGSLDAAKLAEHADAPLAEIEQFITSPLSSPSPMSGATAVSLSRKLHIPLHPRYTYHWNLLSAEQFRQLSAWLCSGKIVRDAATIEKIILPRQPEKDLLSHIGIPHLCITNEFVVIEAGHATALFHTLLLDNPVLLKEALATGKTPLDAINAIAPFPVRDKSGVFIGARMGRPEKAKMRELTGSPHALFPVGEEGGRMRSIQSAIEKGRIRAEYPLYFCASCSSPTIFSVCERCGQKAAQRYFCSMCGIIPSPCKHHPISFQSQEFPIAPAVEQLLKKLNMRTIPSLVKGVRGTSNDSHVIEHLAKGILRAKYDVYVNKDGTTRYDMTQLPITHFKPKEIGTSIERLIELGYTHDIAGKPLTSKSQILELGPQDVILPACPLSPDEKADEVMFRLSKFIDDLLENMYGLPPYYQLKSPADITGHLVVVLAPHTAAGIIGRIIGFSQTQGLFAHPMLHAATRRDCDGDESCASLLLDVLINFSRRFLPSHRGSTQDTPLVITSRLNPSEVDDMVFDIDIVWKYPLEFYSACLDYKSPWEIDIERVKSRLNSDHKYDRFGFTHDTSNINAGVLCSAYKTIPTMEDKLKGQMRLAEKIRAVRTDDVARLVIEKHFLKDTKGNLRKFSMQKFRCSTCNESYRRPPLIGKCGNCGGTLIFTIAEGSVTKYLEPSISLAEKYDAPPYLKQTLQLLKWRVESVFGRDKEKQIALESWFS
ncbi:DNA polymerase II large subunit [Candidatus Woesearchaeota archaeon]|nr:DNA polymerase II large subunit [Candidatus Woesearchaeota archaeon]